MPFSRQFNIQTLINNNLVFNHEIIQIGGNNHESLSRFLFYLWTYI